MAEAIPMSTIGVKVSYCIETTAGTRPTTGYTHIKGIKSTPDMNVAPSTADTTTFDNLEYTTHIDLLKEMPDTRLTLGTSFTTIYDCFLAKVSDDMYMELTELDTYELLQDLLINAIPRFEFPRVDLFDYELGVFTGLGNYQGIESDGLEVPATGWVGGSFNITLNQEEINVLVLSVFIVIFKASKVLINS